MLLSTLALFVVSLGYGVIAPLLPELALGTGAGGISIVYAVYAAAKIGAQIPGGVWVDRAGPARVLRVALVLFCLSLAGFLVPGGAAWIALLRLVEGAATGLVYPAVFARTLRGAGEATAGKRLSAVIGVGTSGLLVGPALGGTLAPWGARVPVAAALALAVLVTLVAAFGPHPAEAPPAAPRALRPELGALAALARNVAFLGLMLPIAFNKLTFSAFQGLLPLYGASALGLHARGVTLLFALTGVCFAAAQGVAALLLARVPASTLTLALTPPLLLALAAMAGAGSAVPFGISYCAYIVCSSIIFTATMKHAARTFGTEDTYGGLFGLLATLTDLMTIVGPLLFLNLYRVGGRLTFVAMALIGVGFGALSAVHLRRSAAPRA
jgi:DHA1 family multidrug resistance protein-like MFS transporter